jgi:hypothetical protein
MSPNGIGIKFAFEGAGRFKYDTRDIAGVITFIAA